MAAGAAASAAAVSIVRRGPERPAAGEGGAGVTVWAERRLWWAPCAAQRQGRRKTSVAVTLERGCFGGSGQRASRPTHSPGRAERHLHCALRLASAATGLAQVQLGPAKSSRGLACLPMHAPDARPALRQAGRMQKATPKAETALLAAGPRQQRGQEGADRMGPHRQPWLVAGPGDSCWTCCCLASCLTAPSGRTCTSAPAA